MTMTTKTLLVGALVNLALGCGAVAAQERPSVPTEYGNTKNVELRMREGPARAAPDSAPLHSFWLRTPEVNDAVIVGGGDGSGR
jgi:hypothetical protein